MDIITLYYARFSKAAEAAAQYFGAAEGLLLDRLDPNWKDRYFEYLLSTDPFFER